MSQPRQFEGPDVRVLLDEIRATYGSDPVISRAETFRSGGFLGFFQQEKYRLVVEGEPIGPGSIAAVAPAAAGPAPLINDASPMPTLAAAAYAAVAGRGAALDPVPAPGGPVSTLTLPAAGGLRYDADDDTLAADLLALLADQTEDYFESSPPRASSPAPEVEEAEDRSPFEAVLRRVSSLVEPPVSTPSGAFAPAADPVSAAVPVSWPTAERTEELSAGPVGTTKTMATAAAVGPTDDDQVEPAAEGRVDLRLALYRAGLGAGTAAEIDRAASQRGLNAALLEAFEDLPQPPPLPRRHGSLVVVAGPGPRAAGEATRISSQVGADPGGVAFASQRPSRWPVPESLRIRSTEDAMELAPGHRRGRVGVVAVDVPVGSAASAWARHIIRALRPTLVVGVVDAMYKSEDIDAWARDLDGVDTLIVDNVDSTASPARILELDLPVSHLGGQAANPARWAATVLDRIPAELTGEKTEAIGEG